jgi:hypothetical protein
VVLFDQAHGQSASIQPGGPADLSGLKNLFREQGFVIQEDITPLSEETMQGAAAVIISGPLTPLTSPEIQAIGKYLNNGGQISLMLENAAAAANLLSSLQIAVANGILREQENMLNGEGSNFSLKDLPEHPLTRELDTFNMYGAWPLQTALEANVIARTSNKSWVDLNGDRLLGKEDAVQSFHVLITGQLGHGHFVVFGDAALLQNQFLKGKNATLGRNLARWFKQGSYY